jgi:TPR repeat protein
MARHSSGRRVVAASVPTASAPAPSALAAEYQPGYDGLSGGAQGLRALRIDYDQDYDYDQGAVGFDEARDKASRQHPIHEKTQSFHFPDAPHSRRPSNRNLHDPPVSWYLLVAQAPHATPSQEMKSMKHAVILNWVFAIAVVPAVVGAYDLESAYRSRGGYDYHKAASSRDGVYDINAARAERGAFEGVKPGTAGVATNALPAVSESSLDWYRAAAARGRAEAQFCLGAIYEEGRLVPQDLSQAVAWYRQAAAQGNADAWIALAGLHDIGKGVPRNPAEADAAWRKAAELGNVAAQYMHAERCYQRKTPDLVQAAMWYRRAAESGSIPAQYRMGEMMFKGEAGPQNYAEALKWYGLAASTGFADAQYALGLMYDKGLGVARDAAKARDFYAKAAAQGHGTAKAALGEAGLE